MAQRSKSEEGGIHPIYRLMGTTVWQRKQALPERAAEKAMLTGQGQVSVMPSDEAMFRLSNK